MNRHASHAFRGGLNVGNGLKGSKKSSLSHKNCSHFRRALFYAVFSIDARICSYSGCRFVDQKVSGIELVHCLLYAVRVRLQRFRHVRLLDTAACKYTRRCFLKDSGIITPASTTICSRSFRVFEKTRDRIESVLCSLRLTCVDRIGILRRIERSSRHARVIVITEGLTHVIK